VTITDRSPRRTPRELTDPATRSGIRAEDASSVAIAKVLVVAGDHVWAQSMERLMVTDGFEVTIDNTGDPVVDGNAVLTCDVAIVDLDIHPRSGVEICRAFRDRSPVPVIALGDRVDEQVFLAAFDAGVDQCVDIRISYRQLHARMRSVLRRTRTITVGPEIVGPVQLDRTLRTFRVRGTDVALTEREFVVLELLVSRTGRVTSRRALLESRGPGASSDWSLDLIIRRLRERLRSVDAPCRITVVRSVGFLFDVE
jgi:DNA-binding response OmpR family regulator